MSLAITGTVTNAETKAEFEVFGLEPEQVAQVLAAAITAHPRVKCWVVEEEEPEANGETDSDESETES